MWKVDSGYQQERNFSIMGSANAKPSRQKQKTRTKPDSVVQISSDRPRCYVCGCERSPRVFTSGPDQFICSGRNCSRIKSGLEHSLSRQPIIQINHYEDDITTVRIIQPGQNAKLWRNVTTRNVCQPSEKPLAVPKSTNEYVGQSLTVGRSELMGDSKHRRSAIEP